MQLSCNLSVLKRKCFNETNDHFVEYLQKKSHISDIIIKFDE